MEALAKAGSKFEFELSVSCTFWLSKMRAVWLIFVTFGFNNPALRGTTGEQLLPVTEPVPLLPEKLPWHELKRNGTEVNNTQTLRAE